eukprot:TRINITY_DN8049_c0_g1_i1.p1 TRINITY_DN8049_c0_g1~~TRINITY_DN8049_c0_g1_i1.p1  ORF type:complete len:363 (+),score=61.38 TRINITY_DN8049_c0_g1_i1:182-1270(+)
MADNTVRKRNSTAPASGGDEGGDKGVSVPRLGTEKERAYWLAMVKVLTEKAPQKAQPFLVQATPHLVTLCVMGEYVVPRIGSLFGWLHDVFESLPEDILIAIVGVAMCFFGGVFPASIAAFEAWHRCGGQEAWEHVKQLWNEGRKVKFAHRQDTKILEEELQNTDDKTNVIETAALVKRKAYVALKAMNPTTLNDSVVHLYFGWVGVLAVLKIQFAKVVTLGDAIAAKLYHLVSRIEPKLAESVPEDLQKWIPIVVRWACTFVAITIAWFVNRIVSALHSAVRGGYLCASSLAKYLKNHDYVDVEAKGPYAMDFLGLAIAFLGLIFQFTFRFGVPFPLNLLTWPLSLLEAHIMWVVSGSTLY